MTASVLIFLLKANPTSLSCSVVGGVSDDDEVFDEANAKELLAVVRLRVKRLRSERNLSQEEVVGRVPMDVRAIQRFEAEDFEETDPQIRTFMKIAYGLGVALHE